MPPAARTPRTTLAFWIATTGGAGLTPRAPGTVGGLVGIVLAYLITPAPPLAAFGAAALLFALGTWAADAVERAWQVEDPQFVVVDETFGALATLLVLPPEPLWWAAGFVLFRVFDMAKPWPASLVHRHMRGGLGIMLDDALAATMAGGALLLVKAFLGA